MSLALRHESLLRTALRAIGFRRAEPKIQADPVPVSDGVTEADMERLARAAALYERLQYKAIGSVEKAIEIELSDRHDEPSEFELGYAAGLRCALEIVQDRQEYVKARLRKHAK